MQEITYLQLLTFLSYTKAKGGEFTTRAKINLRNSKNLFKQGEVRLE